MAHSNTYRITACFMLFHNIAAGAFGVFRRILIMYKDLLIHINTNNPPQIGIPLIANITTITGPITKSSNSSLMFLK
jgi:hypothetical protein